MTYRELFYKATRLINHHQITLGEYEEMTKPLDREVKQEPKSEWEQDHAILKAYSDGVNEVLDKVRDEIQDNAFSVVNPFNTYEYISVIDLDSIDEIHDKYKAESKDKE